MSRSKVGLLVWPVVLTLFAVGIVAAQSAKPTKAVKFSGDPYPLAKCAVSGEKLGSMGDPIVRVHEGREIRFCCKGCLPAFKKDPAKVLAEIDRLIVEQQRPSYPVDTCVVSDEGFDDEDMGDPIEWVVGNRLIRLCCKTCKKHFKKDPDKYLTKLDAAVVAKQEKNYPIDTCLISGEKLGSMGDSVNFVMGNRLYRLCCKMCKKKVKAEPSKYRAMLDSGAKPKKKGKG